MFFNITNKKLDNFPNQIYYKNFVINLDNGWCVKKNNEENILIYKGYLDEYDISTKLEDIVKTPFPQFYGNFCLFECKNSTITIITDILRSFPIWYSESKGINNLVPDNYTIWTDSFVSINDSFKLSESKFALDTMSENTNLELDLVLEKVDEILTNKIRNFFNHNKLPVKVFLSGGIDTMLVYSYIKKLNIEHHLLQYNHVDFDYFYLKNHDTLSNFWGYKQIHHWKEKTLLVSGSPGDEFTVRSPCTANLMLRFYNKSIACLLETHTNSMHYTYFNKGKNFDIWNNQKQIKFNSLSDAVNYCLNINYNDWQHWHLGNTLTYTPLRDAKIFQFIARLEEKILEEQIMNSVVQKRLIEKNDKKLLAALSTQKNSFNNMENLTNLFV